MPRKKVFIIITVLLFLGSLGFVAADFLLLDQKVNPENSFLSPLVKKLDRGRTFTKPDTDLADKEIINVLLLGIDRRSRAETGYRTDIMILVTMNKTDKRIVMTSIPRDLWYGNGRINALYINQGFEGMQDAFEEITGLRPDRYVLTDFKDFSWLVDALGGVAVDVKTSFTDVQYPNDATNQVMTISFTQGPEIMTGDRALIFARSRKGDNDNGDWGRMKRQHLLLKGISEALVQKDSFICIDAQVEGNSCEPNVNTDVIKSALTTLTTGKMDTNMQVGDLAYLWDFYHDRQNYTVESLFMDYEHVFTPPMEEYGGAWVLAPIGGSYANFHKVVSDKVYGVPEVVVNVETEASQTPQP